jgi:formamidopyrimidine-DNA glycosylase
MTSATVCFFLYKFYRSCCLFPGRIFIISAIRLFIVPELPEVETIRREITPAIRGRCLSRISGFRPTIDPQDPHLGTGIRGRCISDTSRHGKYLFAALDAGCGLVIHFGMTGDLRYLGPADPDPPYCRAHIVFEDGSRLVFTDPRRFGRIISSRGLNELVAAKRLGPDALSLTRTETLDMVRASQRGLKLLLLDQHRVAGIGNIYADEILFQSRIHPERVTVTITKKEADRLYRAIFSVLETAVRLSADMDRYPSGWLIHRRAPGRICPACGGVVDRVMIAGRYSYFCPSCQQ